MLGVLSGVLLKTAMRCFHASIRRENPQCRSALKALQGIVSGGRHIFITPRGSRIWRLKYIRDMFFLSGLSCFGLPGVFIFVAVCVVVVFVAMVWLPETKERNLDAIEDNVTVGMPLRWVGDAAAAAWPGAAGQEDGPDLWRGQESIASFGRWLRHHPPLRAARSEKNRSRNALASGPARSLSEILRSS
jgi:hypothetical protein